MTDSPDALAHYAGELCDLAYARIRESDFDANRVPLTREAEVVVKLQNVLVASEGPYRVLAWLENNYETFAREHPTLGGRPLWGVVLDEMHRARTPIPDPKGLT